jgi:hypothetical protein
VTTLLAVAAVASLAATGCDDKKPSTETTTHTDAGATDKYATADPKLAKALQAAASASTASDDGPPPAGIFAPGAADKRHAKGVPTKVDVVRHGSDPKISLGGGGDASTDAARATSFGPAILEVAQQQQRQGASVLDYGLMIGPPKPADGLTPDQLVATLQSIALPKDQGGQAPPGMDKDLAGLQGSQIRLKLTADGMQSDMSTQLSKGAKTEFDRLVENAAESLAFGVVPLPGKPVGAGAQWIAETRSTLSGLDVVTYRAFRVKSVEGDRVHLSLDVKAYATEKDVTLPGLPKGAALEQFDAVGQGDIDLVRGEILARKADVQQRVVMIFSPPGGFDPGSTPQQQQQQMLTAQIVTQATLVRGDDLKQALKHP